MTAIDTGHPYDIAAHILSALRGRGWIGQGKETRAPEECLKTAPARLVEPPTRRTDPHIRIERRQYAGRFAVVVFVSKAADEAMGEPSRYDLEREGDALYLRAVSAGGYAAIRRSGRRFTCNALAGLLEGMSGHYGVGADGRVG